ncbi:unnamed protein product [Camellia sinensis]
MSEEEGKVPYHHRHQQEQQQQQTQYGTFQGVANYPPPQPVIGFPQSIPPPGAADAPPPGYYAHGCQAVPGYAVAEGRPVRERRLPCCSFGFAWFLFITGFFLAAIPCYVGAIIEKPGYFARTVVGSRCMMSPKMVEGAMAVIGLIAIILLRHASPRVAPYVEYAGFLSLAISFFAITTVFLPFTWIICPAVLLSHAFVRAFFKLRIQQMDILLILQPCHVWLELQLLCLWLWLRLQPWLLQAAAAALTAAEAALCLCSALCLWLREMLGNGKRHYRQLNSEQTLCAVIAIIFGATGNDINGGDTE